MKIIALIGLNGSGKTTTAKRIAELIEQQGDTAIIESFATPLKNIASKFCGFEERNKNSGQRDILESLAKTMKDELGQELFAYAMLDRLEHGTFASFCIIDDLRYAEELDLLTDFFEVYLFKMPNIELADAEDYNRLGFLLEFVKEIEMEVFELKDLSDETLLEYFTLIEPSKEDRVRYWDTY
jgi:ABC-type dipeptide/oligopeptide/nickel transport system ATPase component